MNLKALKKVVSSIVAIAFLLDSSTVAYTNPAVSYKPLMNSQNKSAGSISNLFIPESYGTIEKQIQNSAQPMVVLIKDAHCNYEAQTNISKILETLIRDYKIDLVCVEGAEGLVDTSIFSAYPDQKVREKTADKYVKKGYLSASEALSIGKAKSLPFTIYGVEDTKLYLENFKEFRNTMSNKQETGRYIELISNIINQLKNKIYNEKLLSFDKKSVEFQDNKLSLTDWTKMLSKEYGVKSKENKNFNLVLKSVNLEDKINFKKVEQERALLIKELEKLMVKEDLQGLIQKSLLFKLGKMSSLEYYLYLKRLISANNLHSKTCSLIKYIHLLKLQSKIDSEGLFNEIDEIESKIRGVLYTNEIERKLDKITKDVRILNKLYSLSLTRKELLYYKDNKSEFLPSQMLSFITTQARVNNITVPPELDDKGFLSKVEQFLQPAEYFYEEAVRRDDVLVNNLVKKMEKENKDTAVAVIGGFHADGIIKKLEAKNISYTIITPKITKVQEDCPYLEIMMDKRIDIDKAMAELGNTNLSVPLITGNTGQMLEPWIRMTLIKMLEEGGKEVPAQLRKESLTKKEFLKIYPLETIRENIRQAEKPVQRSFWKKILNCFSPENIVETEGLSDDQKDLLKQAENVLKRIITVSEFEAIKQAHEVGKGHYLGKRNADGTYEKHTNPDLAYTEKEIWQKVRILAKAKFSKEEREKLIKYGVAGVPEDPIHPLTDWIAKYVSEDPKINYLAQHDQFKGDFYKKYDIGPIKSISIVPDIGKFDFKLIANLTKYFENHGAEILLDGLVDDFFKLAEITLPADKERDIKTELENLLKDKFFKDIQDILRFEELLLAYERSVNEILDRHGLTVHKKERIVPILVRMGLWAKNLGLIDVANIRGFPDAPKELTVGIATKALAGLGDVTKIAMIVNGLFEEFRNRGVALRIKVFVFAEDEGKTATIERGLRDKVTPRVDERGVRQELEIVPIRDRSTLTIGEPNLDNVDVFITLVRPVAETLTVPKKIDPGVKSPRVCFTLGEYDSMVPPNPRMRSVSLFEVKTGFSDDSIGFFVNPYTEELYRSIQSASRDELSSMREKLLEDTIVEIWLDDYKKGLVNENLSDAELEQKISDETERCRARLSALNDSVRQASRSSKWGVVYMHHQGIKYLKALDHFMQNNNNSDSATIFTFFGKKNRENASKDEWEELKNNAKNKGLPFEFYDISADPSLLAGIDFARPAVRVINLGMRSLEANIRSMALCDMPIGVTGDESLLTALTLRKPVFYEVMSWKKDLFDALRARAIEAGEGKDVSAEAVLRSFEDGVLNSEVAQMFDPNAPANRIFSRLGDTVAQKKLYPGIVPQIFNHIALDNFFAEMLGKYPLDISLEEESDVFTLPLYSQLLAGYHKKDFTAMMKGVALKINEIKPIEFKPIEYKEMIIPKLDLLDLEEMLLKQLKGKKLSFGQWLMLQTAKLLRKIGLKKMALTILFYIHTNLYKPIIDKDLKKQAVKVLDRAVSDEESLAIQKAHNVGGGHYLGKQNSDGTYKKNDDPNLAYTDKEIWQKVRILKKAGFKKAEREKLIKYGVAGVPGDIKPGGAEEAPEAAGGELAGAAQAGDAVKKLEVVTKIESALKEARPIVILGSPGSGKTEQMQIALGRNAPMFDLRERFFEYLKESGRAAQIEADAEKRTGIKRSVKDLYKTEMPLKIEEKNWISGVVENVFNELMLEKDEVIVFDEFDLAVGEKLEGDEITSANLMINLARRLSDKGKRVILIIHSKGMRTPGFIQSMVDNKLLRNEGDLIQTRYLSPGMETQLLGLIGISGNNLTEYMEDVQGVPAGYLGLIEYMAKITMGEIIEKPYHPTYRGLVDEAEKKIEKNYKVAKQTADPKIAVLLRDIATGKKTLQSEEVLKEKERLLDTGLIGERDGKLIMPPIVRRVIKRAVLKDLVKGTLKGIPKDFDGYLDAPHYNRYHTEGGINATLADHLNMMLDAMRDIDKYGLPGEILDIVKSFNTDVLIAYILLHDVGKFTKAKLKDDGVQYNFKGHEEESYTVLRNNPVTYKGTEIDAINRILKIAIRMHAIALDIEEKKRKMEGEGVRQDEVNRLLEEEFGRSIDALKEKWKDDFKEEMSGKDLDEVIHFLVAGTVLDCLGQKPIGKEYGDIAPALLLLDLYGKYKSTVGVTVGVVAREPVTPEAVAPATEDKYAESIKQQLRGLPIKGEDRLKGAFLNAIEKLSAIEGKEEEWTREGYTMADEVKWHGFTHVGTNTLEAIKAMENARRQGVNVTDEAILLTLIACMYHDVGYYTEDENFKTIKVDHEMRSMQFVQKYARELGLSQRDVTLACLVIAGTQASVQPADWDEMEKLIKSKDINGLKSKIAKLTGIEEGKLDLNENDFDSILGVIFGARVIASLDIWDTRENAVQLIFNLREEFERDYNLLKQYSNPSDSDKMAKAAMEISKIALAPTGEKQVGGTKFFYLGYANERVRALNVWQFVDADTKERIAVTKAIIEKVFNEKPTKLTPKDIENMEADVKEDIEKAVEQVIGILREYAITGVDRIVRNAIVRAYSEDVQLDLVDILQNLGRTMEMGEVIELGDKISKVEALNNLLGNNAIRKGGEMVLCILKEIGNEVSKEEKDPVEKFRNILVNMGIADAEAGSMFELVEKLFHVLAYDPSLGITKIDSNYYDFIHKLAEFTGIGEEALLRICAKGSMTYQLENKLKQYNKDKKDKLISDLKKLIETDIGGESLESVLVEIAIRMDRLEERVKGKVEKFLKAKGLWSEIENTIMLMRNIEKKQVEIEDNLDSPFYKLANRLGFYSSLYANGVSPREENDMTRITDFPYNRVSATDKDQAGKEQVGRFSEAQAVSEYYTKNTAGIPETPHVISIPCQVVFPEIDKIRAGEKQAVGYFAGLKAAVSANPNLRVVLQTPTEYKAVVEGLIKEAGLGKQVFVGSEVKDGQQIISVRDNMVKNPNQYDLQTLANGNIVFFTLDTGLDTKKIGTEIQNNDIKVFGMQKESLVPALILGSVAGTGNVFEKEEIDGAIIYTFSDAVDNVLKAIITDPVELAKIKEQIKDGENLFISLMITTKQLLEGYQLRRVTVDVAA